MEETYDQIVAKINEHLGKSGRRYYSEFYIGVSNNAPKRLFEEHHVDRENSWWIYITAANANIAKEVELHYLELGMRGEENNHDDTSRTVYCYAVTPTTTE